MAKIRTISDQEEATLDVLYNLKIIQIKKMSSRVYTKEMCSKKNKLPEKMCLLLLSLFNFRSLKI